jgi:hypothetical protein
MDAKAYITLRAPQFAANASLDDLIACATDELSATAYGINTYKAVALLVCHWLALLTRDSSGSSPSGNLSSEKAGKLARSFSGGLFTGTVQASLDPYLASTSWGVELSNLQQGSIPMIFNRMM